MLATITFRARLRCLLIIIKKLQTMKVIRKENIIMDKEKKVYVKPEVIEELDLETKAGSPCPPADPNDLIKPPC
jgi:hypothetical protein